MSPRNGRPPLDNPKSERLFIRVTPDEKRKIQEFVKSSEYGLLDLIKIGIETVKKN